MYNFTMRCKNSYLITLVFVVSGLALYFSSITDSFNFVTFNGSVHYKSELGELQNYNTTRITSASQYSQSTDFLSSLRDALQRAFEQPDSSTPSSISIQSTDTIEYTYECCNSNIIYPYRKSILYLKTHKCASSTLQNIFMRFGLHHELNFMLPKDHHTVITYHQPYRDDMIPPPLKTPDGKYDILAHHIRYSPDIKNVLPPGTVSITMLRSVPSLFESIYYFYGAPLRTGISIQNYLKNPFDLKLDTEAAHGLNQMSMDLGFERKNFKNETAIASFIEFIDSQFDLVMIVEHLDESLVLLAHLMGWPLDHVSYLSSNVRKDDNIKYQLTESDEEKIKQLNTVDTLLYDHFLNKFQKCRHQFGIERLQNEVKKLHALNRALEEKCVAKEKIILAFNTKGYVPKNIADWECIYSTMYSGDFTKQLKIRQSQRLRSPISD